MEKSQGGTGPCKSIKMSPGKNSPRAEILVKCETETDGQAQPATQIQLEVVLLLDGQIVTDSNAVDHLHGMRMPHTEITRILHLRGPAGGSLLQRTLSAELSTHWVPQNELVRNVFLKKATVS